jgi:Domain of unknown function (DUF4440)
MFHMEEIGDENRGPSCCGVVECRRIAERGGIGAERALHGAGDQSVGRLACLGALEKPVVGKAAYNDAFKEVDATRQNHKQSDDHVDRLVVAPSGDMAYEYGTSHISFDREKKHVEFTAAYLRVWKASGKECKIAAMMAQPEGER